MGIRKALHCNVYRNTMSDSTNEGLSSKKDELYIVGEGSAYVDGPTNLSDIDEDYLVITKVHGHLRATPKSLIDSKRWVMFGGNFIYTSDSRFPSNTPIKIFDRVEEYKR